MNKKDRILAVDIGADSLKLAEFLFTPERGMVLEKFDFVEYGRDVKEEERILAFQSTFREAVLKNKFKSKRVHLSISGQAVFIRFVKLPPAAENENRIRQMVEFEAKQNVPYPIEEVVWDYQLIGRSEGEESEIEVMFVVVKNDFIKAITDSIEAVGMETSIIDVAPTACYNAARANQVGGDECVMILNIGGRTSSLVFIDSGRFYVRNIPIAGYTITQQISKEFGISYEDAEEMKRKHGFVALGGAYEEPESEVAATVSKIVRNVMTRLHGEINRSINVYRSQQKGAKPAKLYLAGGSSVLAFTPRFFSEKLKIPVDYFNPFQVVSLGEEINRESLADVAHMFSEVIGLGLRGVTVCPIEISLIPESVRQHLALKHRTPYFYGAAASMLICFLFFYLGLWKLNSMNKALIGIGSKQTDQTKSVKRQIDDLRVELGKQKALYETAANAIAHKSDWINLLNEISARLPDNTWLVEFKPTGAPSGFKSDDEKLTESKSRRSIFGSRPAEVVKTIESKDVEWISLTGHSLVLESGNMMEAIKDRLRGSDLLDKIEEVDFQLAKGDDNVTKFELNVKLKKPIPK